jgi:hypothetical protein
MRFLKMIPLLVLMVGTIIYVGKLNASRPAAPLPQRGFTIQYNVKATHGDLTYMTGTEIRLVSENGNFKSTLTQVGYDGTVVTNTTIGDADGVYGFGKGQLELLSGPSDGAADNHYRSEEFLRTHPKLVRKEQVMGYDCYVIRQGDDHAYAEEYYSPVFGATSLKQIKDDGQERWVLEAVFIDINEPDSVLLKKPEKEVEFNIINDNIDEAKRQGKIERAAYLEATRGRILKK